MKKEVLLNTLLFVGGAVVAYKGIEYFLKRTKVKKDYVQVPIEIIWDDNENGVKKEDFSEEKIKK